MISAKVSEFIDVNTWQWNRLKVCETLHLELGRKS